MAYHPPLLMPTWLHMDHSAAHAGPTIGSARAIVSTCSSATAADGVPLDRGRRMPMLGTVEEPLVPVSGARPVRQCLGDEELLFPMGEKNTPQLLSQDGAAQVVARDGLPLHRPLLIPPCASRACGQAPAVARHAFQHRRMRAGVRNQAHVQCHVVGRLRAQPTPFDRWTQSAFCATASQR